uniref:S30AE n=1 Tax=Panagrellus redivivus TaxID=6233 RepID=A0A7E4V0K4_PANRE
MCTTVCSMKPLGEPVIVSAAVCKGDQVRLIGAFSDDELKSSLAAYFLHLQKHPETAVLQYIAGTGVIDDERLDPVDISTMTPETPTDKHLVKTQPVIQPPPIVSTCPRHPKEHVINRFSPDGQWPNLTWNRKHWKKHYKVRRLHSQVETHLKKSDSLSSGFGSARSPGPSISEASKTDLPSVEQWVNNSGSGSPPPYGLPEWFEGAPLQYLNSQPMPPNPLHGSIALLPDYFAPHPSYHPYTVLPAPIYQDNCIFLPISYPPPPPFFKGAAARGPIQDVYPIPYGFFNPGVYNAPPGYLG